MVSDSKAVGYSRLTYLKLLKVTAFLLSALYRQLCRIDLTLAACQHNVSLDPCHNNNKG